MSVRQQRTCFFPAAAGGNLLVHGLPRVRCQGCTAVSKFDDQGQAVDTEDFERTPRRTGGWLSTLSNPVHWKMGAQHPGDSHRSSKGREEGWVVVGRLVRESTPVCASVFRHVVREEEARPGTCCPSASKVQCEGSEC